MESGRWGGDRGLAGEAEEDRDLSVQLSGSGAVQAETASLAPATRQLHQVLTLRLPIKRWPLFMPTKARSQVAQVAASAPPSRTVSLPEPLLRAYRSYDPTDLCEDGPRSCRLPGFLENRGFWAESGIPFFIR